MSKSKLLLIRLFLIAVAVSCFMAAYKFFDAAMPYVGEISGNPHPSETAKIMGPKMMKSAMTFFIVGLACSATLIATQFIKAPTSHSPTSRQPVSNSMT
jgi:hypothetical protein